MPAKHEHYSFSVAPLTEVLFVSRLTKLGYRYIGGDKADVMRPLEKGLSPAKSLASVQVLTVLVTPVRCTDGRILRALGMSVGEEPDVTSILG